MLIWSNLEERKARSALKPPNGFEPRTPGFGIQCSNTGLVSSRVSLTSWGAGASSALAGQTSSDGVKIKMPYGVDVYYIDQPRNSSFPIELVKTESDFVRSVETGLGRWMPVVAVISVDAYPFFGFLRPDLSPWKYRNTCFLLELYRLIVTRPNFEVATNRLLHLQVKIPG